MRVTQLQSSLFDLRRGLSVAFGTGNLPVSLLNGFLVYLRGTWWGGKSHTGSQAAGSGTKIAPAVWPQTKSLLSGLEFILNEEVYNFRWWIFSVFVCKHYLKIHLPIVIVRPQWENSCENTSYQYRAIQILPQLPSFTTITATEGYGGS